MEVVKFKLDHLKLMVAQGLNDHLVIDDELFKSLETEESFSIMDGDKVLLCGGVVAVNIGRGVGWTYIAEGLNLRTMVGVTQFIKRYLNVAPFHRIEMHVDCDFDKAHNWARHLGFDLECKRMKSFTPDKRDCSLYAMTR